MNYPLSVYAHIPFCDYRCRYCNFTFETGWSPALLSRTLDAIVAEAADERRRWEADGLQPEFQTLYFGGGTPGIIPPKVLGPFLSRLHSALGTEPSVWNEAGFEVNPENVTPQLLQALEGAGITRLSVGIQTFDTARLKLLGRWCDREVNLRALELIARHWRGTWSADLMTGLPGGEGLRPQTWTDLKVDLSTLLSFAPPHVSLYSLTVEPETALATMLKNKTLNPATPAVSDQLWIRARDTLVERGYQWYEISNFALPGQRSQHNPVYWRMDPWLGLGPGAEGNLVSRNESNEWRPVRTRNAKLFPWLTAQGGARTREFLTAPEYWLEHFLTGWRTRDGVSSDRLSRVFSQTPAGIPLALSDDQRLALNTHLERLDNYDSVQFQLNWFSKST